MSDGYTGPMEAARRLARPEPPRRFYRSAAAAPVDGGFALMLDGRRARTPARRPMIVADAAVAEALAREWSRQGDRLEPEAMPVTRIVNAAIDRVADEMVAVRNEIVRYGGSDLLCYRASEPEGLVALQTRLWPPILAWAETRLGVRLELAHGIVHVPQPPEALAALVVAVTAFDALRLSALYSIATLTGSAVIALAVAHGALSVGDAWAAAHVDEDWQMETWGPDQAAIARRNERLNEMQAAALILAAGG